MCIRSFKWSNTPWQEQYHRNITFVRLSSYTTLLIKRIVYIITNPISDKKFQKVKRTQRLVNSVHNWKRRLQTLANCLLFLLVSQSPQNISKPQKYITQVCRCVHSSSQFSRFPPIHGFSWWDFLFSPTSDFCWVSLFLFLFSYS